MKMKIACNIWSAKESVPTFEQIVSDEQKPIAGAPTLAELAAELNDEKKD